MLNNNGQVAFSGLVRGTGVNFGNDGSIFFGSDGALTLVARDGDIAPNSLPNETFAQFDEPLLNNAGQVAFLAPAGQGRGIFGFQLGEELETIVSDGDIAPGINTTFFSINGTPPARSPSTHRLAETTLLFFLPAKIDLIIVAEVGSEAPGTGGIDFLTAIDPAINDAGETAFRALLSLQSGNVDPTNDEGIFAENGGVLELVARAGAVAPGTEPGVNFNVFDNPVINNTGQVAFTARLTGADGLPFNDRGLFATDENGELQLIARTGDLFDVNDDPLVEDLRAINSIAFGNLDRRRDVFNSNGELAFRLNFSATGSPGGSGIFVASTVVPEPNTGVLLTLVLVGVTSIRQKKLRWLRCLCQRSHHRQEGLILLYLPVSL